MALRKRLSQSDDDLEREIAELRDKERAFRRAHALLREDKHAGVDVSIANARENFERRAAECRTGWGPDPQPTRVMEQLAGLWAASRLEFAADLHAAVDGPARSAHPSSRR